MEMLTKQVIMDQISLKYGEESQPLRLANARLVTARSEPHPDPEKAVREALKNPIGLPPLAKICHPGEKVVIVTSDITRYTASEIYLPLLIKVHIF